MGNIFFNEDVYMGDYFLHDLLFDKALERRLFCCCFTSLVVYMGL